MASHGGLCGIDKQTRVERIVLELTLLEVGGKNANRNSAADDVMQLTRGRTATSGRGNM